MLKSIIIGFLLMLCFMLNTALGASNFEEYHDNPANLTTALQVHDRLSKRSAKKETTRRIISVKTGDTFSGVVELAEPRHNPAKLTLYIRNIIEKETTDNEVEIEATAVMKIGTVQTTYGLHGVYAPDCQQMILYEIQDIPAASGSVSVGILINNVLFEPVGLAGKFTDDGNTIQCAVAYNGNASLERLANEPYKFVDAITALSSKKPHYIPNSKELEN